jgi:hypothetical protein
MKKTILISLIAMATSASPSFAQTTLKIGYANTKESHLGVGASTFCEAKPQAATCASISPAARWVASAKWPKACKLAPLMLST